MLNCTRPERLRGFGRHYLYYHTIPVIALCSSWHRSISACNSNTGTDIQLLPNIFVAIILFVVGYRGKNLCPLLKVFLLVLALINIKNVSQIARSKIKFSVSKVAGQIVRWLIMIFFVEAVNLLNLDIITNIEQPRVFAVGYQRSHHIGWRIILAMA